MHLSGTTLAASGDNMAIVANSGPYSAFDLATEMDTVALVRDRSKPNLLAAMQYQKLELLQDVAKITGCRTNKVAHHYQHELRLEWHPTIFPKADFYFAFESHDPREAHL